MPLRTAYQHCPDAIFLPVDYAAYVRVSRKIKAILREFSSRIEAIGLDEAFLDISGQGESPEQVARSIKARIQAATGLSCSVGIGPNKLLAKMASDLDKPDGLTRLDETDIPRRVWPLAVRKVWGVGPRTEARLAELGVTTIGELARLPLETLQQHFGPAHGGHLYAAARGIDDSPVVAHRPRKSIGCETTFQEDIQDHTRLLAALESLCREANARLRRVHCKTHTVTLKLRFADFETHTRALTLDAASDETAVVVSAARDCLRRIPLSKPVRLLGIRLSRLEQPQRSLGP
jgi:DNA polymerase-4